MTEISPAPRVDLRIHWFWPVAIAILAVNAAVILLDGWHSPRIKEIGVLFDLAVLVPMLYLVCYRQNGKRTFIRAVALACLGIWAAGHIVPDENHALLTELGFLRYIGLAVLVAIEIRIGIEIFRLTFRSKSDAESDSAIEQKAKEEGIPPWVAKLTAWESRVWRKAWLRFRGLFRS